MATINIDSASSGGRYLRLQVTEQSVNARNNTSVVSWILFSTGDSYPINVAHDVSAITVTINGTQVYYKGYTSASTNAFPATAGQTGGTVTVTHNTNGKKTITCKLEGEVDSWVPTGRTKDLTLTNIDRTAPTVSMAINSITDTKISFTTTVSTSCDLWQYSLNDGAWTTFYSTNTSTAQSYTITGLSPNTSYTLKVRARKYSNYVYGSTSNASFSTYGGSLINSVNTVTADASTVSITYSATVYNSDVTHTLELKNGSTTILTFSGISVVSGNNTITLSSSQRTTLLNAMSTIKSFTGTFVLRTYVGSTEIGSGTSRTATVQTTSTNSTPTFSGFTYVDGNSTTVAVTGNNQILIQNKSSLMITCSAATAKNGASISSYSVSAGSVSKSSTSTSINVGLIPNTGTVPVTVTAIDSRGYSKSVTVNVTVLAYNDIAFTQYSGRRENEIENTIQVAIQGSLTALMVSSVNKNALVTLRYRYKETSSSSWSSWYNVTSAASVTSSGFTYNNNYLVSLDSEKSWNIEFNASDKLTSDTITLTIPQGIPLISYRPKKVGINTKEPRAPLELDGDIIIRDDSIARDYVVNKSWVNEGGNVGHWLKSMTHRPTSLDFGHVYYDEKIHCRLDQSSSSQEGGVNSIFGEGYVLTFMWDTNAKWDTQFYIPDADGSYPAYRCFIPSQNKWSDVVKLVTNAVEKTTYANTSVKKGALIARRQGNMVSINSAEDAVGVTANTWVPYVQLGTRYRPNETIYVPAANVGTVYSRWIRIANDGWVYLFSSTAVSSASNFGFSVSYIVD